MVNSCCLSRMMCLADLHCIVVAFPLLGGSPEEGESNWRALISIDRYVNESYAELGVDGGRILHGLPFILRPVQTKGGRRLNAKCLPAGHFPNLPDGFPYFEVGSVVISEVAIGYDRDKIENVSLRSGAGGMHESFTVL